MFWFYNNSNIAAKIELNLCDVKQLNEANKFTIFECVYNDTLISPKGIWPLMVKFHPIELTRYQVIYLKKSDFLWNELPQESVLSQLLFMK